MDDLISRKAAIDALWKALFEYEDKTEKQFQESEDLDVGDWIVHRGFVQNMSDIDRQTILNLPSAPRWIPATERLPEIDMSHPHHEDYLVQYDSGDMDVASWSNVNRFWTDHVTEPYWNCVQFAKVIAWMPLPEPWKGECDGY